MIKNPVKIDLKKLSYHELCEYEDIWMSQKEDIDKMEEEIKTVLDPTSGWVGTQSGTVKKMLEDSKGAADPERLEKHQKVEWRNKFGIDLEALGEKVRGKKGQELEKEVEKLIRKGLGLFVEKFKHLNGLELREELEKDRTCIQEKAPVFGRGAIDKIRSLISNHEGKENTVIECAEGMIKTVGKNQAGTYGSVDSCMTITVTMENGIRIMAHAALYKGTVSLEGIKKKVEDVLDKHKTSVKFIDAIGAGDDWTPSLKKFSNETDLIAFNKANKTLFENNLKNLLGGKATFWQVKPQTHVKITRFDENATTSINDLKGSIEEPKEPSKKSDKKNIS